MAPLTWINNWYSTLRVICIVIVCSASSTYSQTLKVLPNGFGRFNFDEAENYLFNVDISTEPVAASSKPLVTEDSEDSEDIETPSGIEEKVKGLPQVGVLAIKRENYVTI